MTSRILSARQHETQQQARRHSAFEQVERGEKEMGGKQRNHLEHVCRAEPSKRLISCALPLLLLLPLSLSLASSPHSLRFPCLTPCLFGLVRNPCFGYKVKPLRFTKQDRRQVAAALSRAASSELHTCHFLRPPHRPPPSFGGRVINSSMDLLTGLGASASASAKQHTSKRQ